MVQTMIRNMLTWIIYRIKFVTNQLFVSAAKTFSH